MAKRSGIMLFYPFSENRLNNWNPPYLVQPKLDGVRCRALWSEDQKEWLLLSSTERVITSVPHINKALKTQVPRNLELDGELYHHGISFDEISSITSRTVNLHSDYQSMEFHLFDIVDLKSSQFERTKLLNSANWELGIKKVKNYVCNNFDEVIKAYDKILLQNYEGIIVRHIDSPYVRKRSVFGMKFKPKKSDIYNIIGFNEEVSKNGALQNRIGSLVCIGNDHSVFSVGSGLSSKDREEFWEVRDTLTNYCCHVQYQNLTVKKQVPLFPVFISLIEKEPEVLIGLNIPPM